jgi:cation:H+ antiporter
MAWIYLVIGLGVLTVGADVLVKGASRLAQSFGVPALVIGLTVVAYGTSAPEMAVSARAAFTGESEIALGNVVGSNIANILLILGLCGLVAPLVVHSQIIKLEVPIMVALSALLYFLSMDGTISRWDGLIFLALAITYTVLTIRRGRREGISDSSGVKQSFSKTTETVRCLFGLAMLVFGADIFVDGAVSIARAFGISELVIGLTIVAVGTSMPEIMTSIVASMRGERDIAVGNVVGSNIFNILGVLGLSATVKEITVPVEAIGFDIPVMMLTAVLCVPFFVGATLTRWRAGLFLASFLFYVTYLIFKSQGGVQAQLLEDFILRFFGPLIVITVIAVSARAFRNSKLKNG